MALVTAVALPGGPCGPGSPSVPKSKSQITFEQIVLLLVALIGAILSHVPARDNLASSLDLPHIFTDGSIWGTTSSSVQEGWHICQKVLTKEGQFVTQALSGDFQLVKEFVKRG